MMLFYIILPLTVQSAHLTERLQPKRIPVPASATADCDPTLVCGMALTCVDGFWYPTTCGPKNCDRSTKPCTQEKGFGAEVAVSSAEEHVAPTPPPTTQPPSSFEKPLAPTPPPSSPPPTPWAHAVSPSPSPSSPPPTPSAQPVSPPPTADAVRCDPSLECEKRETCVDGNLFPTTCGPQNCDAPIAQCNSAGKECDSSLECGMARTCVKGDLYPTTCGPKNCDEPIGFCLEEDYEEVEERGTRRREPCGFHDCESEIDGEVVSEPSNSPSDPDAVYSPQGQVGTDSEVCTRTVKALCKRNCPSGWKVVGISDWGCGMSWNSWGGYRKTCQLEYPCRRRAGADPEQKGDAGRRRAGSDPEQKGDAGMRRAGADPEQKGDTGRRRAVAEPEQKGDAGRRRAGADPEQKGDAVRRRAGADPEQKGDVSAGRRRAGADPEQKGDAGRRRAGANPEQKGDAGRRRAGADPEQKGDAGMRRAGADPEQKGDAGRRRAGSDPEQKGDGL